MEFSDKVVWITGASSGIGEGLVYAFDKQNAKLVLSARRQEELERVKTNCTNTDNIFILPLDLTEHDKMPEKAKQVIDHFGQIDILINNGGISQRSLAQDTPIKIDKKIMDINYFGSVAITKAVMQYMLEKQSGHFVAISSVTGKIGVPKRSAYAGSKHAIIGFFDTLRSELRKYNIKVTIVCPGYIRTNISLNALTKDGTPQKSMDKTTNAGMTPEELAGRILNAVRKEKEEVYIGGKEILGIYLKRYTPRLFSKVIRKQRPV